MLYEIGKIPRRDGKIPLQVNGVFDEEEEELLFVFVVQWDPNKSRAKSTGFYPRDIYEAGLRKID